ncbi:MAG: flavin reductase family protein [Burkholderiaceae bacterium]|jgi:flavin reductase (DIM6/NTAB) family NADH-FMN oxidoreductase RutF|nr:flavin reductase family protein [Betaproteobacteria bacterium]
MHFDTATNQHGMRHDPFKAVVVPRPIGWIGSVSPEGVNNLAPYSFFNAIADKPPMVMFSSQGYKDSQRNIEATGEFTCSLATRALTQQMNMSSAPVAADVDEFLLAGLTAVPGHYVRAPRVAESPVALECKLWKMFRLPGPGGEGESSYTLIIGRVVGMYIDDAVIRNGRVDIAAVQPLARLGYMDYSFLSAENMFELNRPSASADGKSAQVESKPWDGVYR